MSKFQLEGWLNTLFPFHISFDQSLVLTRVGESATKAAPSLEVGKQASDVIKMVRPAIPLKLEKMGRTKGKTVQFKTIEEELTFKGQIVESDDSFLFVGSPRFGSSESFAMSGLKALDFAPHDAAIENLLVQQLHHTQLNEQRELLNKLRDADVREKRLAAAERSLEHDLNSAADVKIRTDAEFRIESLQCAKQSLASFENGQFYGVSLREVLPGLKVEELVVGKEPVAREFEHLAGEQLYYFDARVVQTLEGGLLVLVHDLTQQKLAQLEKEKLQQDLVLASRHAGMAEVASGVLHNVGNVLNSISVSVEMLTEMVDSRSVSYLSEASKVLAAQDDVAEFLTNDPRGKHFPGLLAKLADSMEGNRNSELDEIRSLQEHINHIGEVIKMQQSLASQKGVLEDVDVEQVILEASKINVASSNSSYKVVANLESIPVARTDKHKLLQILVNLFTNATHAIEAADVEKPHLAVEARLVGANVEINVCDNGVGIKQEDLKRIFTHGFTTKPDGHGFGLHSCALAAQALGGTLSVSSDGPGLGARFQLTFPLQADELCKV